MQEDGDVGRQQHYKGTEELEPCLFTLGELASSEDALSVGCVIAAESFPISPWFATNYSFN